MPALDPAAAYGTIFSSKSTVMFFGISPARPPSLTEITWVMKIANVSIANFSIIFVGLSKAHRLSCAEFLPLENAPSENDVNIGSFR